MVQQTFLRTLELDDDALTKAIIGTMGDLDAYQLPDAKGYAAFSRLHHAQLCQRIFVLALAGSCWLNGI
jgi:hypothetical protein